MQIAEIIDPSMTRRDARAALKRAGWTFVGGGSFATVYASPDETVVAKVTKPDAGAAALYKIAQKHPDNPHFPRYQGRIKLGSRGYVYEVERLTPWYDYDDYDEAEAAADDLPSFEEAHELIRAAIRCSRTTSRRKPLDEDFGFSNAMRRGSTFVFTDPLFAEEDLSRSYRGRGASNPDNSGYGEDPDDPLLLAA
jgi:hypothetical protein